MTDLDRLKQAEARELFRSWSITKDSEMVRKRLELCNRKYGPGAMEQVRGMMTMMKNGEME